MFPTSKFKTLTILTLIVVFVLVLSIWLMYQHFFGEGILSKLGIKKGYSEETLTIADDTMNIIAKESTLKELIGYYEKNKVKRDDIVVVKLEGRAGFPRKIAAVPGDTIEFEGANLKVNGKVLENSEGKPFLFPDIIRDSLEGKVPEDSYLAISDQTSPSSFDSRQFGFIGKEELQGKIVNEE